jgi:hypothetical protein
VPGTSITCSDGFGTRNDPQTVSPKHWPCARPRAAVRAGMSGWTLCRPPPSPAPRGLRPPRPGPLAAPSGHGPSRSALIAPLLRLIALRWRVALLRGGASKGFSVSRVREPGTAERDSVCLRPDGDRRMPGTRPSCPWRQTSPARPPLRDFTYSANSTILGPRSAREGAHRRRVAFGARGCGARRPPVAFRAGACRSSFSGAWLRHARFGEPPSAAAPLGTVLRDTGLPSRSALATPPLRLAALRWRAAFVILGRFRPPPGVSTACLVASTHFSLTRLPRIATLENVPTRDRGASSTFSRSGTSHRCVPSRALQGT